MRLLHHVGDVVQVGEDVLHDVVLVALERQVELLHLDDGAEHEQVLGRARLVLRDALRQLLDLPGQHLLTDHLVPREHLQNRNEQSETSGLILEHSMTPYFATPRQLCTLCHLKKMREQLSAPLQTANALTVWSVSHCCNDTFRGLSTMQLLQPQILCEPGWC